jgi:glutamine synthetase
MVVTSRWQKPPSKEKEMYQRAIALLNAEFKRMGVTPTIGMEMEFYIFDKNDAWDSMPILDDSNAVTKKFRVLDAMKASINKKLARFNEFAPIWKGPVDKFYKEITNNKYEITSVPVYAEQATEIVRHIITEAKDEILEYSGKSDDKPNFQVTFNADSVRSRIVPAQHTSIGFLRTVDGKTYDAFSEKVSHRSFADAMNNVNPSLMLLFAPKPASYGRLRIKTGKNTPKFHRASDNSEKDNSSLRFAQPVDIGEVRDPYYFSKNTHRIENRLPSSDTPPYKAIFGTMLSAYAAMLHTAKLDQDGKIIWSPEGTMEFKDGTLRTEKRIATNIQESAKDFEDAKSLEPEKPLWELLDRLSPDHLGTEIYNHELKRYKWITSQKMVSA